MQDKETLIQELDKDKDFGPFTRDEIAQQVREGTLVISEGLYSPVLRHGETGRIVRGSGAPIRSGVNPADFMASLGDEFMQDVVESLVNSAREGDSRAAMFLIKMWMGDSIPTYDAPPLSEQMRIINGSHNRVHN